MSYSGDGSTTVFSVNFYFLANADLRVVVRASDGTETIQTLGTDYTVSGAGNENGGSVTFTTAPVSGTTVVIVRNPPVTQLTDYNDQDPFPAASHERALDKLTMIVQRNVERLARAILLKETNSLSNLEFPDPEAGKILRWNSSANGIENATLQEASSAFPTDANRYIRLNASGVPVVLTAQESSNIDELKAVNPGASGLALLATATPETARNKLADFDTVAGLVADTSLAYSGGDPTVSTGDIVEAGGFRYEVAASGASDQNLTTAGGVKLYVPATVVHVQQFNTTGDGVADDGAKINAFFEFIAKNECEEAVFEGTFLTGEPIIAGQDDTGDTDEALTKKVRINATVTTDYTDVNGTAFLINGWQQGQWSGYLKVICGPTDGVLANRRQLHAIYVRGSLRADFGSLWGEGTVRDAIVFEGETASSLGNNNLARARHLRATHCGHTEATTISSFSNTGSSNSFTQRTVITPATIPTHLQVGDFVKHEGFYHWIESIDTGAGTVTVFPWLVSAANGNTLNFIVGGGVRIYGNDSNLLKFDHIDVASSPMALRALSLFGPIIDSLHYNRGTVAGGNHGAAVAISGRTSPSNSFEGMNIQNLYVESGTADYQVLCATSLETSFVIGSMTADSAGLDGFLQMEPNADNGLWGGSGSVLAPFKGVISNHDGRSYGYSGSLPRAPVSSSVPVSSQPTYSSHYHRKANSPTITLEFVDNVNALWGNDTIFVSCHGTGSAGQPTGTVTFAATDSDTVNGGATATFSGLTGPGLWACHYNYSASDWIVKLVSGVDPLTGSATYDPPSLADGAGATTTVTVTGAALGDFAEASFSLDLQGITLTAWVSAADTVSARFQNESGGTLDLGSGTLRARVIES